MKEEHKDAIEVSVIFHEGQRMFAVPKQGLASLVQDLPFGVGGGLVAIKTLLSRDPCVHANTAIEMIDAILKEHPAAQQEFVCSTGLCHYKTQPAPVQGPDWKAEYLKSVESGCITLDELREALAELDATNRQVEILSDALAESRREVAALKAVQEPVAWMYPDDYERMLNSETFCTVYSVEVGSATRGESTVALYTTPPAAQQEFVCSTGLCHYKTQPAPVQPVAHCEAGPGHCQQCYLEDRSLALAAAVRYVQNNTPKLVSDEICMALSTPPAAQPAVPDAITDRSEYPEYIQGWNDCRAEMLKGMKP
jgi:hypothetical protein